MTLKKKHGRIRGVRGTCKTGKVRYRDEISAKIALSKIKVKDSPAHTEKRHYLCPECAGWHLTSKA